MKPKYYPHITIMAAVAMVIVPLCFVLSLPYLRIEPISHNEQLFVDVDHDAVQRLDTRVTALSASAPVSEAKIENRHSTAAAARTSVATADAATKKFPGAVNETRVAMLPRHSSSVKSDISEPSMPVATSNSAATEIVDTDAVLDMASIHEESIDLYSNTDSDNVPVPENNGQSTSPFGTAAAEIGRAPVNTHSADVRAEPDPHSTPEYAASQVEPPSYFEATGHLAMAGGALGGIAGTTPPPVARPSTQTESGTETSGSKSKPKPRPSPRESYGRHTTSKTSRSKTSVAQSRGTQQTEKPIPGFDSPLILSEDGFTSQQQVSVIDVILQQPLESHRVGRMENVVAVSREQGWPIALVKSDLPDDHWWVQQMVGVRGNAFAARVNFGNEHSIPGSVYHMVFVFLESPDEVRRFRIAKQFDELPEGVRRSREFTFVRK